jgi:release factor glutamine methyltransferase
MPNHSADQIPAFIGMTERASSLGEWRKRARTVLSESGIESPDLSVLMILEKVTGLSRSQLLAYPEKMLSLGEHNQAKQLLERRRQQEPMAYLVGWKDFHHLRLKVSPDVLIPRPETEELLELAFQLYPKAQRILDVGTGSGCIALALSDEKRWKPSVFACDISPRTLAMAVSNDPAGKVKWFQSDWLSAVRQESMDLIISNPPYLTQAEMSSLDPQVGKFEPRLALSGGEDGCDGYRILIPQAWHCLKKGGCLVMEGSPTVAAQVLTLLATNGFERIQPHPDLSGKTRFFSGWKLDF